jgi:hypothetical protein
MMRLGLFDRLSDGPSPISPLHQRASASSHQRAFASSSVGYTPIGAAAMYESAADVRMDLVEVGSALLLLPIGRCAWTFSTTTIYTKTT